MICDCDVRGATIDGVVTVGMDSIVASHLELCCSSRWDARLGVDGVVVEVL